MDRITASLLTDFKITQSLTSLSDDRAFERFANFCVISKEYQDTFNVEDVSTGDGDDTGIDGFALLVNGTLVTSVDEIDDLYERNGHVEATFIFVQAKSTSGFSGAEMSSVGFGVKDFFSSTPKLRRNEFIEARALLQARVFERAVQLSRGNPTCKVFYVTTGKWQNDQDLVARVDSARKDLEDLELFKTVTYTPIDADGIQKLFQNTQMRVKAEITFAQKTVLPEIEGVKEALIGVLPAAEYMKLLTDETGNIRKSLFYDNVRDFQGENEVNDQIRNTLRSDVERDRFAMLNNGVTVIAKSLDTVGNRLVLEDYQIVNGCQTSHVLYEQRTSLDGVYVPTKIIVTNDDNIINAIIRGTNSQTQVKADQLLALSDYQKTLEKFFESFTDKKRLYYERRSRQYASATGVEKVRIVTIQQQIRVFASMFLDQPHRASRSPSALLKQIGGQIFAANHRPDVYYSSAYAQYKLEYLFRSGAIDVLYKPARYQLLMLVRYLVAGPDMPPFASNKMEKYCRTLLDALWDEQQSAAVFDQAAQIVRTVSKNKINSDTVRTEKFTESVIEALP